VPVWQFLADVERIAGILGPSRHVLNACNDRYRFAVGFAATLQTGKLSLLPSSQTPEMLRQLTAFAPDVVCLTDEADGGSGLPGVRYTEAPAAVRTGPSTVPQIEAWAPAACVFTSGSTGTPLPYRKTFGKLIECVRVE
jgi:acyl-coenzyme A synthetase/AMP-(fatty) acid ligase